MILDWRANPALPHARCFDAETGDRVHQVRWYDTATHELARLATDEAGVVLLGPDGHLSAVYERRRLVLEWFPDAGETVPDLGAA